MYPPLSRHLQLIELAMTPPSLGWPSVAGYREIIAISQPQQRAAIATVRMLVTSMGAIRRDGDSRYKWKDAAVARAMHTDSRIAAVVLQQLCPACSASRLGCRDRARVFGVSLSRTPAVSSTTDAWPRPSPPSCDRSRAACAETRSCASRPDRPRRSVACGRSCRRACRRAGGA